MLIAFCKKHPVLSIFALAVFVRIVLLTFFPLPDQTGGDFALYQRIADNILTHGNFGGEPYRTYGDPSISPGWGLFLASHEFFFGKSVVALIGASVVLGGLLAVGTYLLAALFFDRRSALIAGIVSSVWPVFLIQTFKYGTSLMLYSVLLLFGSYLLAKAIRGGSWHSIAAAGLLLGFAALVDAIGLFVPLALIAWAFIERWEWRTAVLILVFLAGVALVIAPWTYRNIVVSHIVPQKEIPVVSKNELRHITPSGLSYMAKLTSKDGVLISGLSKMYVYPFDISILDQGTEISYQMELARMIHGEQSRLSEKQFVIFLVKIGITIVHWLLLALAAAALILLWQNRFRSPLVLTMLLGGYVTAAVVGFGSLAQDDFQSISGPNSFLFPLIPFFIALASFALVHLYEWIRCVISKYQAPASAL